MSVEDCELAARSGAHYIGMIMWPKAKRSVSVATAAAICECAKRHGAEAVGVFVDESADTISKHCSLAGLQFAQLHGDRAREALHELPEGLRVIYVMHASPQGEVQTAVPSEMPRQGGAALKVVRAIRHLQVMHVEACLGGSLEKEGCFAAALAAGA
jgi:phosphoribosylanthranilate isomerase